MGLFAAFLNLCIAGSGYAIQGKLGKALGTLVACVLFGITGIGIIVSLLIMLYTAFDAYKN